MTYNYFYIIKSITLLNPMIVYIIEQTSEIVFMQPPSIVQTQQQLLQGIWNFIWYFLTICFNIYITMHILINKLIKSNNKCILYNATYNMQWLNANYLYYCQYLFFKVCLWLCLQVWHVALSTFLHKNHEYKLNLLNILFILLILIIHKF